MKSAYEIVRMLRKRIHELDFDTPLCIPPDVRMEYNIYRNLLSLIEADTPTAPKKLKVWKWLIRLNGDEYICSGSYYKSAIDAARARGLSADAFSKVDSSMIEVDE